MSEARRPLRIALMIETDGPGGAEVVIIELARELRRRGHEVIAVGPAHGRGWLSGKLRELGFERHTYTIDRPVDPQLLWRMTRMLRRLDLDVIHSHEFDMAFYGSLAARFLGIRHVITMHGSDQVMRVRRRRVALRMAGRLSAGLLTVSDHSRAHMAGALRIPREQIGVVWNGVPDHAGDREGMRRALKIDDDEVTLLSVGSLRPRKGHAVLVRAAAALARAGDLARWRLLIAGQGPEDEPLRALARELGIADHVQLLGLREDIPDLQAAADVFVMPSLWEGLPMAILEAMFGSCPVVASDVGGIAEAITPGIEGELVPADDPDALAAALRPIVGDAALRRRMGDAARARAERDFHVRTMADGYERYYYGEA